MNGEKRQTESDWAHHVFLGRVTCRTPQQTGCSTPRLPIQVKLKRCSPLPSVLSSAKKPQARVARYWCHTRKSTQRGKKILWIYGGTICKRSIFFVLFSFPNTELTIYLRNLLFSPTVKPLSFLRLKQSFYELDYQIPSYVFLKTPLDLLLC